MDPEAGLDELLLALVIILGASAGAMALAKRFRLSPVIGLFATGFVVGPSVLGVTQNVSQLREIAWDRDHDRDDDPRWG